MSKRFNFASAAASEPDAVVDKTHPRAMSRSVATHLPSESARSPVEYATMSTKAKTELQERRNVVPSREPKAKTKAKPLSKRVLRLRKRKRRVAVVQRDAPCSRVLAVAALVVGGLAGHWYIARTTRGGGTLRIDLPSLPTLTLGELVPHASSVRARRGDATLRGDEGGKEYTRAGAEMETETEANAEAETKAGVAASRLPTKFKWLSALSPNYACDDATAGLENAAPVRRGELRHRSALFFRRAEFNSPTSVVTLVTQVRVDGRSAIH